MIQPQEKIQDKKMGTQLYELATQLYPICRSITGDGVRKTLQILQSYIPVTVFEVPSGTAVLDWTVPQEWNVREAWVKDDQGNIIIDFANHNLHLLNYSIPIHQKMELSELKAHLYTLPDQPDLIPYRTSYYAPNWGFCLSHNQYEALSEGTYEVFIDSDLKEGHLTYGECWIPGKSEETILFTAHVCHPSLANDNLSGISLLTYLAKSLLERKDNYYSYRFLFIPGTIGSITWLARNEAAVEQIHAGIVASLLGDDGDFTYKKSRRGNTEIDFIVEYALKQLGYPHKVIDFFPYGYDERQFCSPGFNLPVGNLTRSQFGQYPEYHTSGDNLDLIKPVNLQASFEVYAKIVELLEENIFFINQLPKAEPQLGKRGLYNAIGGNSDSKMQQMAMLWLLNACDGNTSLLQISERAKIPYSTMEKVSKILVEHALLVEKTGV